MYRWIVLVVLSVHSDRSCYSWCWFVLPERYKYWVNKLIDSFKSYDTRTRVGVLIHPRSRMKKKKLRLHYLLSDSTSHVRLSFLVNWQDVITAWLFASTGTATRELDLRCWDWTRTFPQRVDNRLASNRKDQVTDCLFEQLLLRFKRKVGWRRHGQVRKFEAQEAQWKWSWTTAAESSSADSLEMHALASNPGPHHHRICDRRVADPVVMRAWVRG